MEGEPDLASGAQGWKGSGAGSGQGARPGERGAVSGDGRGARPGERGAVCGDGRGVRRGWKGSRMERGGRGWKGSEAGMEGEPDGRGAVDGFAGGRTKAERGECRTKSLSIFYSF